MTCIHCRSQMKRGTAPFHIDRQRCHLMLESVPAWVCVQYVEAYFEEKEVDAIQELIRSIDDRVEALALTATSVGHA